MNDRRLVIALSLLFLVAGGFWWAERYVLAESPNAEKGRPSAISDDASRWQGRIAAVGGHAAYQELAREISALSPSDQHVAAHEFGIALFEARDLDGLSVCDERFSYGCFHEFLGRAITAHGLSVVGELNEGCIRSLAENSLSCQHGIGHGVQAHIGYDEDALERSLAECRDLPYNDPIGGCYGGVFMEYNLQTMLGKDARVREFTGKPHYPCNLLGEPYTIACTYWQPQWWHQAIFSGDASEESYAQMGEFCREAGVNESLLRACMEGLGTITSQAAEFSPERVALLCDSASATLRERLFCTSLAANALGLDVDVATALRACAGFTGESANYCQAYARNEANILETLSVPSGS